MASQEAAPENKLEKHYNVFVGSETGLLKGINIEKAKWQNLNTINEVNRSHEVHSMCWGNAEQTQVCYARKDKTVVVYDTLDEKIVSSHNFPDGEGHFCGLEKYENAFLTCTTSGLLKLWQEDQKPNEQITINVGADVCKMRQNPEVPYQLATGGKENELKVWDLTRPAEPIFRAKNVRNDWLDLRVPVWVTDCAFIPGSRRIVTCTGHHKVRVYDPSTPQRRPVFDFEFDEYPLTAMSLVPGQEQVIVGNTQGAMALIDIRRKGLVVRRYKGFAGGIRSVQCHPTLPMVASCGLDRFLRIHDLDDKTLLHKFYLKSRLNCLLFAEKWKREEESDEDMNIMAEEIVCKQEDSGEDSDVEQVWQKMAVVQSVKKQKVTSTVKLAQKRKRTQTNSSIFNVKTKKKKTMKPKLTERPELSPSTKGKMPDLVSTSRSVTSMKIPTKHQKKSKRKKKTIPQ